MICSSLFLVKSVSMEKSHYAYEILDCEKDKQYIS